MSRDPLPEPVNQTDRYLHDIATSLRTLAGDQPARGDGKVDLREPARKKAAKKASRKKGG